jgi:RimJ/RimL family protein N-acetyltransferase
MVPKQITSEYLISLKEQAFGCVRTSAKYKDSMFHLVLVTRDCIENDHIIHLLSRWRKENEFWFPAIFPVSDARTKGWLKDRVIDVEDRLLFLIEVDGQYIGHVGLWHFDFLNHAYDIDNVVRGVNEYVGIMYNALTLLHHWAYNELGIKNFYLQTLIENPRAMKLYQKLGYKVIKTEPLIQKEIDGRMEWVTAPEGYEGEPERTDARMHLQYSLEKGE